MTARRTATGCGGQGAIVLAFLLALVPARSGAAPVTGLAGYDHYAGPLGQRTDGVVGAMIVGLGENDLVVAGLRYDDTLIGRGYGLTGGFGWSFRPAVRLRASATRFLGDGAFRAWRTKMGPELDLPAGWKLTLSYARYEDNADGISDGAIAEAAVPLTDAVTGRVSASSATTPEGPQAMQGSAGISWTVVPHLSLSGELGLARSAAGATGQPFPGHPGLIDGLPLLGGGDPASGQDAERKIAGTLLLGVRVALP